MMWSDNGWRLGPPEDICGCPAEIRVRFFRRGVQVWEGTITERSDPREDRERFDTLRATMVIHDCPQCHRIFYWWVTTSMERRH